MIAMQKNEIRESAMIPIPINETHSLHALIESSWSKVAPFWPVKNFIAVNPIAGFEDLPFEEALKQAKGYFQQKDIPERMQEVNRESIKWLQAFFDEGQSTIYMPNRHLGFLKSILSLIHFDKKIHKNNPRKRRWLKNLPQKPEAIIAEVLFNFGIPTQKQILFLTLMLTTLPGWASHIKYRASWCDAENTASRYTVTEKEYLAFRLIIAHTLEVNVQELIAWHENGMKASDIKEVYQEINLSESAYQASLLKKIEGVKSFNQISRKKAQVVFCIDVRSEPFRRAIEAQGDYETYGFAGFFGMPVTVKNSVTGDKYASCPVLVKPADHVTEYPSGSYRSYRVGHYRLQGIKKTYQSLKYNFTTPFNLVEAIGFGNGLWMGLRNFYPNLAENIQSRLKNRIGLRYDLAPDIQTIPLERQVVYAASALKIMGLVENFAPLVVFCGHRGATQNNAYSTALDCGACGGHGGASNARILASILNSQDVRKLLIKEGIVIPNETVFVAAEHNTTTDEVAIYSTALCDEKNKQITVLKEDLKKARDENSFWRANEMKVRTKKHRAHKVTALRANDWAQVRPEWGLAKNAAFIVAPRWLTKPIDLEGRAFLHSYDWENDEGGYFLTSILTAPMVVAQWINSQYFFSTLDNVAFGGGSKITKNITGKIGIMQGNASDLMTGLPLQSVHESDQVAYHKSMRLTVIVYAPTMRINRIIKHQEILKKLFGNQWVHLIVYDPIEKQKFSLQKDLTWCRLGAHEINSKNTRSKGKVCN